MLNARFRRLSLRARLVAASLVLTGGMCAVLAWMALGVSYMAEDHVHEARLDLEISDFLRRQAVDANATPAPDRLITGSLGVEGQPHALHAALLRLPDGRHEWLGDEPLGGFVSPDGRDRFLDLRTLADGRRLFYVYDVSPLESESAERRRREAVLALVTLLLLVLTTAFALLLGHWVFAPAARLEQALKMRTADDDRALADTFASDEIGALAKAFDVYHERLRGFIARERRFTRDASHELRTPITVLSGALDILRLTEERMDDGQRRALERMCRAVASMRVLVDAFLRLARNDTTDDDTLDLATALTASHERLRPLLDHAGIRLLLTTDAPSSVFPGAAVALGVVLDNLLRNALDHGIGDLDAHLVGTRLTISNRCRAGDQHAGHGLGLGIARAFCERYGWRLTTSTANDRFIAELACEPHSRPLQRGL